MDKSVEGLKAYAAEVGLFQRIRERFLCKLKEAGAAENSLVVLQGGSVLSKYDTDTDYSFRQESHFFYLFGVEEPDTVGLLEVATGKVHLAIPRLDENLALYLLLPTLEFMTAKYSCECHFIDELAGVFSLLKPHAIYLNSGINSDSGTETSSFKHDALTQHSVNSDLLYPVLCECRVIKLTEELEILKRVALAASEAHVQILKTASAGQMEYTLPATLLSHLSQNYGQEHSFTPIAASGHSGSVLHYILNNKPLEDGDLVVCDMGSYGYGFCSDITCTFPVSGKFTVKQKNVYSAVLAANQRVLQALKPGVNWTDMHLLAEKTLLEHLIGMGVLCGDPSEMQQKRVGAVFMPHGLGHFLGLDVHDVGGYTKGPPRIDEPGLRNLRTRRELQAGMLITVEPGCYFIDFALDKALNNPEVAGYFVVEQLNQYRGTGGVRLEDDVLITPDGAQVLSKVPREIQDVERVMAGGHWEFTS